MHASVRKILEQAKEVGTNMAKGAKDMALNIGQPSETKPQIGAGAVSAFVRQGFKELGAALGKVTPESVQIDEQGAMGVNVPPGIVTAQMTGKNLIEKDSKQMDMDK